MNDICVYCESNKGKIWEKTGEIVCLPCRFDFLVTEFEDAGLINKDSKLDTQIASDALRTL